MKKLIIVLFALAMWGCADYGCSTSYVLDNQTSDDVSTIYTENIIVKPGQKKTISIDGGMCEKNYVPRDLYNPGDIVRGPEFVINGRTLPPFRRRHWTYSREKYYHDTYTLVLTDELVDRIGTYTSTYMLKNECSGSFYIDVHQISHGHSGIFCGMLVQAGEEEELISSSGDMDFPLAPFFGDDDPFSFPDAILDKVSLIMDGKQITQYYNNPQGTLFENGTYTLVAETPYERTYEFTFTDEFFDDGVPVE